MFGEQELEMGEEKFVFDGFVFGEFVFDEGDIGSGIKCEGGEIGCCLNVDDGGMAVD